MRKVAATVSDRLANVVHTGNTRGSQFSRTMASTMHSTDTAVYSGLSYIASQTNEALKSFGAKSVSLSIAKPHARGGIPNPSASSRDDHLVVGPDGRPVAAVSGSEGIINTPQMQRINYWGSIAKAMGADSMGSLDELWSSGMTHYARGGRLPRRGLGGVISKANMGRIDEGVDFTGAGSVRAVAPGTITLAATNTGWPGGTFIKESIGRGRYVYYAENIEPHVHVGQHVRSGQDLGYARGSYPFIEVGWAVPGSADQALAHTHYSEGDQTEEGKDFARFLGLIPGKSTAGKAGAFGISHVKRVVIKGPDGRLKVIAQSALDAARKGANKYLDKKSESAQGGIPGSVSGGSAERMIFNYFTRAGMSKIGIAGLIGNAVQESSLNWDTPGGGMWQQISNFGSGAPSPLVQMSTMLKQIRASGVFADMNRAKSPAQAAIIFEEGFEKAGNVQMQNRINAANAAYRAGYGKGGILPRFGMGGRLPGVKPSGVPASMPSVSAPSFMPGDVMSRGPEGRGSGVRARSGSTWDKFKHRALLIWEALNMGYFHDWKHFKHLPPMTEIGGETAYTHMSSEAGRRLIEFPSWAVSGLLRGDGEAEVELIHEFAHNEQDGSGGEDTAESFAHHAARKINPYSGFHHGAGASDGNYNAGLHGRYLYTTQFQHWHGKQTPDRFDPYMRLLTGGGGGGGGGGGSSKKHHKKPKKASLSVPGFGGGAGRPQVGHIDRTFKGKRSIWNPFTNKYEKMSAARLRAIMRKWFREHPSQEFPIGPPQHRKYDPFTGKFEWMGPHFFAKLVKKWQKKHPDKPFPKGPGPGTIHHHDEPVSDDFTSAFPSDEEAIALADLTPGTADDITAYEHAVKHDKKALQYAIRHHASPERITELASQLKGHRDTLKDLKGAADGTATLTDEVKTLTEEVRGLHKTISGIEGVSSVEALRVMADSLSGQVAARGVAPRGPVPGWGAKTRY
jgi:hypothetical protein